MKTTEQTLDGVIDKIEEIKKSIKAIKDIQIGKTLLIPMDVKNLDEYYENEDEILELLDEVAYEILGPTISAVFFSTIKEPKLIWSEPGVNFIDFQEKIDFFGDNGEVNVTFEATIENGAISYKVIDMNFIVNDLDNFYYKIEEKDYDCEL